MWQNQNVKKAELNSSEMKKGRSTSNIVSEC